MLLRALSAACEALGLRGRRILVACLCSGSLIGALFLYAEVGSTSMTVNVLVLALVGAFLFASDTLVSGVASQDLGGPHAAALACGMINGIGANYLYRLFEGEALTIIWWTNSLLWLAAGAYAAFAMQRDHRLTSTAGVAPEGKISPATT